MKSTSLLLIALGSVSILAAQSRVIDESDLVVLSHNTRPEATPSNDRGRVADSFALDHMLLQLKRSAESETALANYIQQLHDSTSPNFHQWLTPAQFAQSWGVAQQDVATVRAWLESHGFT